MKRRPVVITLDRDRLKKLAGVTFSDDDFCELIELTTMIAERYQGPVPPDFMLDDAWEERWHQQPRQIAMEVRRAFVEVVEAIWHECGGTGLGSYHDAYKPKHAKHTGRLNRPLQELWRAAGMSGPGLAATVHHDIEFLRTGTDARGRARKRAWPWSIPIVAPAHQGCA